jgi:hypothetical protein
MIHRRMVTELMIPSYALGTCPCSQNSSLLVFLHEKFEEIMTPRIQLRLRE